MKQLVVYISFVCLLFLIACEKPENRKCWKSEGDQATLEIGLDSVNSFRLEKNIKYHLYESSEKKIVIHGGSNMVNQIGLSYLDGELTVSNENKCHFLRNAERYLEVEIYYPTYNRVYLEPSDSVIFHGTFYSDTLLLEMRYGGGTLILDVDNDYTSIVASEGTGNYVLSGHSNQSEIKIQHNGFGDASGFTSNYMFAYQNSTADLNINAEGCSVNALIQGSGDIYYKGTPTGLSLSGSGGGKLIQY
ncbi:MAG: DUF2807 domain-containing protein [Crocinitomicaceae bacterium]